MLSKKLRWIWPSLLALFISGAYIGVRLALGNFDPLSLAEIGAKYADQDPAGEPGYDGQFSYYIARDLDPDEVRAYLDTPAYRYQRILYPLLARSLALGQRAALPWTLLGVNWVVHGLATLGICWILRSRGIWVGYALIYGLWVGLVAAVGLDLHEPLAYALVVGAWVVKEKGREALAAVLLIIALFAKETTLVFYAAALLPAWLMRSKGRSFFILLAGGLVFFFWQIWLWFEFGSLGIASGGDMASGFELIPFWGLVRIGFVDWRVFGLFLLIFGPTIIMPTLWGLAHSFQGKLGTLSQWSGGALILNSLLVVFLPFSTFREPLGLVRIATGLILSILIAAVEAKRVRVLNYGLFWIAMLAMLIPQA